MLTFQGCYIKAFKNGDKLIVEGNSADGIYKLLEPAATPDADLSVLHTGDGVRVEYNAKEMFENAVAHGNATGNFDARDMVLKLSKDSQRYFDQKQFAGAAQAESPKVELPMVEEIMPEDTVKRLSGNSANSRAR